MKSKQYVMRVLVGLFCMVAWGILSAGTTVSNIRAVQRIDGTMFVDIIYDLATTSSGGAYSIMLEVSPDGGATWREPLELSGDIGPDIMAGTNRHIIWDAGTEEPDEYWLNSLVKITAREYITIILKSGVPMELMKISSGSFMMGSPDDEKDRNNEEGPQHEVVIGHDYYLGRYPVTALQWEVIMETTPWEGHNNILDDPDSPAVYVSWDDIRGTGGFLEKLNIHLFKSLQPYEVRLPSEAEWEYAVRAGTTTRFYWGDDPDYTDIEFYAWYGYGQSSGNTEGPFPHVVGRKLPNNWDLYDMSGNIYEWCEDDWHINYTGAPEDGSAWVDTPRNSNRAIRGGSLYSMARGCRSAVRMGVESSSSVQNLGFRVLAVDIDRLR